jgi:hypothetical protein
MEAGHRPRHRVSHHRNGIMAAVNGHRGVVEATLRLPVAEAIVSRKVRRLPLRSSRSPVENRKSSNLLLRRPIKTNAVDAEGVKP